MPRTTVLLYRHPGRAPPLLRWLDSLPAKAQAKCMVRIERLAELGHELRRPEADLLRDDIHELRASHHGIHYRLLYFFHGDEAVILSHGLVKKRAVPERDISLAIRRKAAFERDPEAHGFTELLP